ncbi:MAG: UDP-N-acetylmuramoyl-tripeptide--D-alanyl-D-alanine ligase [Clostridiales bacterium]|nr:UDP-N-acetylmuramoyl-tripeptide--D-alanyl-D-alanine ligase [Lachnospiraceae bacterium]MDD6618829.1 UDP-N-acetylmuramoyl-tripeptide--D-alanyl-D-alanine ligase [Clostridiales bacterium]MDY4769945.1 UDP-N-acetylmuramoyl-tripeptide--D-alanyl-D-alanine ligase [Lachnospiraceae bacterium]
MKNLTLENIAKVCGGTYHGPENKKQTEVDSIITDSRKAEAGTLFVPIVGERVDAHKFIPDVMAKGALCTLSEVELGEQEFPWIRVQSSLQAVKDIAEFYLEQLAIPVVGITGSVGKTSTKEVIASVLKEKYCTLKTEGNFNNELGLPLTVFRLRDEHEIAVLEMGISDFGEMSRLAKIAKPDTSVITNIGQCHLENLGDRDGVLKAKTEVFAFVREHGHIILNGDDDKLATVKESKGIKPVFFGMNEKFPVHATDIESHGLKGMFCRIHMGAESFDVLIPMPGKHMVYNALAATAVGMTYGLTPAQIKAGIESLEPVSGRFRMIDTGDFLIVDDCYNANPMSMKASVQVLQDGLGRRVAILGDMGELGEKEQELHNEVGRFAAHQDIDLLICVGNLCEGMAQAAKEEQTKVEVVHMPDRETLLEKLPSLIQRGDTILVKASHFMQFETVVEKLQNLK